MRFLHLIRPVMCVLPEVASPDRKVNKIPDLIVASGECRVQLEIGLIEKLLSRMSLPCILARTCYPRVSSSYYHF